MAGSTYSFVYLQEPSNYSYILPSGFNDFGIIVGQAGVVGDKYGVGYIDDAGSYSTVTAPSSTAADELLYILTGINSDGSISDALVVGYYFDFSQFPNYTGDHSFVYDTKTGNFQILNAPGASSTEATGVDNSGEVVGYATAQGEAYSTFGFTEMGGSYTLVVDPFANGFLAQTFARAINDIGTVVGYYTSTTGDHGFVESDGVYTTLDDPDSDGGATYAMGINDSGTIAGYFIDDKGLMNGFVEYNGVYTTIDVSRSLGFETQIFGINNSGQLLGAYENTSGRYIYFIATAGSLELMLSAPAAVEIGEGVSTAIAGLSLSEPQALPSETFTVTLSDEYGILSASGAGVSGDGTKSLTFTGSLAQVNTDLGAVTDTESGFASDTLKVTALDSVGNSATAESTAVTVSQALSQTIYDHSGDSDTITLAATGQFVLTYGSGTVDHVIANGAEAGDLVQNLNHTPDTLEITDGGSFALNSATFNVIAELDQPSTLSLNGTFVGVEGSTGGDTVIVTAHVLNETTAIDLGGADNTLDLQGGGYFHLSIPSTLTGIDSVTAQEGQAAYSGGGTVVGSTEPTIYLRDGLNVTVNVASDPGPNSANPNPDGIVIHGANDADLINLGAGADTVFLGSDLETVIGGGGNDTFYASATTVGATIDGGTGASLLNLTGGGTFALGANISDLARLDLTAPTAGATQPAWDVTAPVIPGLKIGDFSDQADVITFTAAGQSVVDLGSGADTFQFNGANNGIDSILEFKSGLQHIGLSATGFGIASLADVDFDIGPSPTPLTDGKSNILYDTTTGGLFFDAAGGDGHVVQFATLVSHPALAASDFVFV